MSEDFVNGDDRDSADGWAHLARGDDVRAEAIFTAIRRSRPDDSPALAGLSRISENRADWERAAGFAGLAARSARTDAQIAAAHAQLGRALLHLGHAEPARAALNVAILHDFGHVRAHLDMADALCALGRPEAARQALDIAIEALPQDVALLQQRATVLGLLDRHADSVADFRRIADLRPDDPAAHANLGAAWFAAGALDDAARALDRACALGAPSAGTLTNCGLVAMAQADLETARGSLERAAGMEPDDARIVNNYGTILQEYGNYDAAERAYRQAMTGGGIEATRAGFNLGTLMLGRRDWAAGWRLFGHRRALLAHTAPDLPEWDGRATGERVLIHAEQGLGDVIQFARYIAHAAARAPLCVQLPPQADGLLDLIPALAAYPEGWVASGDVPCASHCPLLSLPALIAPGAPDTGPYLAPVGDLAPRAGVVGLVWQGNAQYRFDRRRSVPLDAFAPLWGSRGVQWRSLQRDIALPHAEIVDLSTLGATARAIAGCDLVIAVDTAVAHLAAALGRPVWLLNRFGGDWRWYGDGHAGSAWYRDVTQFQPPAPTPPPECWTPVIEAVRTALAERFPVA